MTPSLFFQLVLRLIIVDSSNSPVVHAHVWSGARNGTATSINGYAELKISYSDTLYISCVGYKSRKISASHLKSGDTIRLETDAKQLKTVYVTPLSAFEIVRKCMENMAQYGNFPKTPYTFKMYKKTSTTDSLVFNTHLMVTQSNNDPLEVEQLKKFDLSIHKWDLNLSPFYFNAVRNNSAFLHPDGDLFYDYDYQEHDDLSQYRIKVSSKGGVDFNAILLIDATNYLFKRIDYDFSWELGKHKKVIGWDKYSSAFRWSGFIEYESIAKKQVPSHLSYQVDIAYFEGKNTRDHQLLTYFGTLLKD